MTRLDATEEEADRSNCSRVGSGVTDEKLG